MSDREELIKAAKLLAQSRGIPFPRYNKIDTRTVFFSKEKEVDRTLLTTLQQPIDLRPSSIKNWYTKKKWDALVYSHRFIPERHVLLGPNLATAHFIVQRGGKVKFEGYDNWIMKTDDDNLNLPSTEVPDLYLEAIDASGTELHYASLDNFILLEKLMYLNLSRCPHIDDWCLDRMVQFRHSLQILDLSECPSVSQRGLACLHKLNNLKILRLNNMPHVEDKALTAIMIEEAIPNCVVEGIDYANMAACDEESNTSSKLPMFVRKFIEPETS